jgi:hypothetical protein
MDKRELKRQYKQTAQPMGIYQIRNQVNGKIFIGSSKNLSAVFNREEFQLKHGSHPCKELQQDFRSFSSEQFSYEVLDTLEPKTETGYDNTQELKILEEMWMEKLQPYGERGYCPKPKRY